MMQSAILVEPGKIDVREVRVPQPPLGGIVVRVRAALTDGTDLKAYRRGHPQMPMPTPFGHEFCGDVAAVHESAIGFAVGDAVMCVHSAPCGRCYWCARGEHELCESVMRTKILGAYAQFIEVPQHIFAVNCYRKPPELSYAAGAFLEPLSCVVHSLDVLGARADNAVLIMGDGGFGILHAALLAKQGVRAILAGRRDERLDTARRLGVRDAINVRNIDAHSYVAEATEGRGADAAIDCTGVPEVWESLPDLVRRGGTVSFFGGVPSGTRVSFSAARMHYDEVRLISPFHFRPSSVRRAYDLLASREIDPLPLVTATVPLAQIEDVFRRLDRGEGIKFAIEP